MQASAEILYKALCHSYSPQLELRQEAEAFLKSNERSAGLLPTLLAIASEPSAEPGARAAAAVFLKNEVRHWWAPVGDNYGKGIGDADKAETRTKLLPSIVASLGEAAVRANLVETFRLVASNDFPQQWPELLPRLGTALQTQDKSEVYCTLLCLRRLFKQLESRPTSRRGDLDALTAACLPQLLRSASALVGAANPQEPNLEGLEMTRLIFKCFYSATHMAVSDDVQRSVEDWMSLLLTAAAKLPYRSPDAEGGDGCQAAKCRKWIFHIFFRFCQRHGNRRRCVNGAEAFADAWANAFAVKVAEACLQESCAPSRKSEGPPKRASSLALMCLGELCCKESTYAILRPRLQDVLTAGIFPRLCFGNEDLTLWQEDPEDFIRRSFGESLGFREPRDAAAELVRRLLKYHEDEVLMPLLQFCKTHLEAHRANVSDPNLCSQKDGALLLLDLMAEEVCALDPKKQKKGKKKSGSKQKASGSSGISIEELLGNFVRPDLQSQASFLRFRACCVYQRFATLAPSLGPPGTPKATLAEMVRLTADAELPVRVRACTALKSFIGRRSDMEVRQTFVENLGQFLERLLQIAAEIQCEELSETVEVLVHNFSHEIIPFAAQLIGHLANQVCTLADKEAAKNQGCPDSEEIEECGLAGALATIIGVLQSCSVFAGSSKEGASEQVRAIFPGIADSLMPLLDKMLRPEGVDFLEEMIDIMTYLTYFCPSPLPDCLWAVFPRLYQCVCGLSTASLPLPDNLKDGWAVDCMPRLVVPLENYLYRGPMTLFMCKMWLETGVPYAEMILRIFEKVVRLTGVGAEKDCASSVRLASAFFSECSPPMGDHWLPRYFQTLWARLPKAETAALRKATFCCCSVMVWNNAELFLQCCEEAKCTETLFQVWMRSLGLAQSFVDHKLFMLAFLRFYQLACDRKLPEGLRAGLPLLVQQMVSESRKVISLRQKGNVGEEADSDDDDEVDEDKLVRRMRGEPDGGDEDLTEDEGDDDEDGGEASVGAGLRRLAPLGDVDEVAVLRTTLTSISDEARAQTEQWMGTSLAQFVQEIDAELNRPGR